ncbi:hypothetical protein CF111_01470 [Aeromonas sobria]|uniref:DUF6988 family protein n=1 Tax=Aeromonas sobria TaxID=646 RepID=UPI000C6DAA64|nr:hypothetical protein [Aeromonas sobria]PKQ76238.1 hypothetical protein CJF47_10865 [Aeromonas sobria]TNJ25833.1 hypothetical protein CF111_01470 [Aeromonas sobria]
MINHLLSRSVELEKNLLEFLVLPPFDDSQRIMVSRVMCSISFEHAESAKMLISTGNLTSATGLVRLQYEALVRAMWLLYAATDTDVLKLTSELTQETAHKENRLPMLSEMLDKLQGKAPQEPLNMLREFKQYSWRPLSSFIHGGIHAIDRHSKGYPLPLLEQMVRISNGVSLMVGMLLVILHGGGEQVGKIPRIQREFADCLPDTKL